MNHLAAACFVFLKSYFPGFWGFQRGAVLLSPLETSKNHRFYLSDLITYHLPLLFVSTAERLKKAAYRIR